MYQIEQCVAGVYPDTPWDEPYQNRINRLIEAKKLGQKTVAFLYPEFDSSTFRYRGYNIAETLTYSFYWCGACFQYADREKLIKGLQWIDILVVIRCPWDEQSDTFFEKVRSCQIRLCYDVDDLIYSPRYMPEVIKALGLKENVETNFWFGLTYRNEKIASLCDAFITTNDYLAAYIKEDFDKPCYTLPNYLNGYQERISEAYFQKKMLLEPQNPFVIGYFSGSPTHLKDLMTIMPEIEEFLNRHAEAVLRIVGYMQLPPQYDRLVSEGRIEYLPFQTFIGLQYEQAKVDINVVPLVNNVFSNCKSELKYFESAIVGTITCATPSYTYAKAIKDKENGYLCNVGEWLDTFERIYQKGQDKKMQNQIRRIALKEYSGRCQVRRVETLLNNILDR
ncbi:MAG: glycosyltransferase family 4 protein [Lachnospiraceae bacterium]|nr:glycosyltransferase family 4 protein [Lachnospiraceae bacterium]